MHSERDTRIPVTIITGFLGSGKTTLLNHWVKQPELSDCAVLINEFGSVGLDHQLVKQVDEQVMLLDSGCICCSVQGSLATALQELFMKALRKEIKPFRRLIIETTGLADPAPVLFTLRQDNFIAERYRFDGIVTLVDAVHIEGQLARQYEAVKQIALADLLVISKSDLVAPEALSALQQRLGQLNGAAPQHVVQEGELSPSVLEKIGPYSSERGKDVRSLLAWLRTEAPNLGIASPLRPVATTTAAIGAQPTLPNNHADVASFSLRFGTPLQPARLIAAVEAVQAHFGDSLLRLKGILQLEGESQPLVIHGVHGQLYPLTSLGDWPEGKAQSRLVFIVRAAAKEPIEQLFLQILAQPEPTLEQQFQALFNPDEQGTDQ